MEDRGGVWVLNMKSEGASYGAPFCCKKQRYAGEQIALFAILQIKNHIMTSVYERESRERGAT